MSGVRMTWQRWMSVTRDLSPTRRAELFEHLTEVEQADFWSSVAEDTQAQRALEDDTFFSEEEPAPVHRQATRPTPRVRMSDDDPLRTITAPEYFEALTGEAIPPSGKVRCPCADHDDRHPSCHVGGRDEYLWHCFSCGAGGTVYDLGAEVSGIEPRGGGFHDLQVWIAHRLLNGGIS